MDGANAFALQREEDDEGAFERDQRHDPSGAVEKRVDDERPKPTEQERRVPEMNADDHLGRTTTRAVQQST